ncbi:hypothetical protein PAMC26510_31250 [Caballeronia sordidicola]|uniref:Uncharacterized protein n=1 Tax=Caballeronia sordidicola TaxID=196367 RepID=A0A242M8C2_CABSO|nr:hypothetical protein PAMC26510_31250 [Caballeronia sordidicola]
MLLGDQACATKCSLGFWNEFLEPTQFADFNGRVEIIDEAVIS